MSEFFTNLLDRHLGTGNIVEPRTPSRFETEVAGSAIPLPIDLYGTDETGDENLEHRDSVVRTQENHSVGPPVNWSEPQRIDPEVKSPVDHTDRVDSRGDHLVRRDNLIRLTANDSILADVNAPEMVPHYGTPVLRQQDRHPVKPKTVEQTNPIKEASEQTSELGYSFESKLDNQIRIMIARLQDDQKVQPAEHAETNIADRSMDTKPDNVVDNRKDRAAQTQLVAPLVDGSEKVSLADGDQEQQFIGTADNRELFNAGLLGPPPWLTEMQAEFNQHWNEANKKSEPEPVVNVTIGRVEVRAVKADPPQKTQRKRKPSGVMSLDDYLNQRERRS